MARPVRLELTTSCLEAMQYKTLSAASGVACRETAPFISPLNRAEVGLKLPRQPLLEAAETGRPYTSIFPGTRSKRTAEYSLYSIEGENQNLFKIVLHVPNT